ncbi:MAG: nitroreductase family protein [Thermoguttaceae bacterium]
MELFEAFLKRHSYRGQFLDKPVPREDLKKIVQAGIAAPSACNAQSPRFVVVDDPGLLVQFSEWITTPTMKSARAVILCISDPSPVYQDMTFWAEDCGAAVQNMLLAITGLGYASVWYDGYLRKGVDEKIGTVIGLPAPFRVQVLLPIGIPAEVHVQPAKQPFEKRAWFNKYEE